MAWFLTQALGIEAYDAANNRTLYRTRVYLNWNNADRYAGYSTSGGGSVDGQGFSFGGPSSGGSTAQNGSQEVYTGTFWVGGDANGYRGTIGASSWFQGSGGFSPGYITASASASGFDYDRRPSAPTFNTISRSIDDYYVQLNGVSSPAGTPTYYIQRSQNSGAWGDDRATSATWFYDLPKGSTQQFRAAAYNSDGWSAWTYSSVYTVPNVPSAPSSISATTPSALSSTISIGASPSNGGVAITGYFVQASPDDGATWLSAQTMTNQSFTYTNLTPGATYKFRAYAVNEMGQSAFTTTGSTFVPAGGKRWTGTVWQPTQTAKRWNGSSWVDLTIAKRWNGTAWVDLS